MAFILGVFLFFSQLVMAEQNAPACPRGLLSDSAETSRLPSITTAQPYCANPQALANSLKSYITEYMCLFNVDANCLSRIAELKAKHRQTSNRGSFNEAYLQEFQSRIGPRIVDQWLHAPASLPPMRFPDIQGDSLGETESDLTSVGMAVASVLPGGNYLTAAVDLILSLGRREAAPVDPHNTCGLAREHYINAFPRGSGCFPELLFDSEPVSRFLKQPLATQTQALSCPETCRYYTALMHSLGMAISRIYRAQLPILASTPRCEGNGTAVFSFSTRADDVMGLGIPSGTLPADWRGVVRERGRAYHYKNGSEQPAGVWRNWNVRANLSDVYHGNIRAEADPLFADQREVNLDYKYRPNTFESLRQESADPKRANGRLGVTYPIRSGGNGSTLPGRTHATVTYGPPGSPASFTTYSEPSHSEDRVTEERNLFGSGRDPALRGLALASSIATGCCRLSGTSRAECMRQLPVISQLPPPQGPSSGESVSQ